MTDWTPVPGFEGVLEATSSGDLRTLDYLAPSTRALQPTQLRKGCVLRPSITNGYQKVVLKRSGQKHRLYVHRLIAATFVPGHFPNATVDHVDGNRLNNAAHNLRWVSRSDNSRLQNAAGRGVGKGEMHPSAKLKDADVTRLFVLRAEGKSLSEIGRQFGVSGSLVHKITSGVRRQHHPSAK